MELAVREAKARLSELIAAAQKGERVVITKHGVPAVELVRCRPRGGIDFDKLEETRRRLGIEGDRERWPDEFNDPMTMIHAARRLEVPIAHRDPFDELLLVQAQDESLKLLTMDRPLVGHPLTVTP